MEPMEFGVTMLPTDFSMGPAELAIAVEERGLDALFIPDHTHIPAGSDEAFRIADKMPLDYSHNIDMFIGLAAAAAVTKRIRLGTGICLVVERDPIITAKEVASIDHISGGRVDFGVGGGWNRQELENHGGNWAKRFKLLRERCEAMKAIWTQDVASYEGEFVNFENIWSWPKPVQKPHPPIFVGGDAARTLDRVMNYGDGWIPMLADHPDESRTEERFAMLAELRGRTDTAGRDPMPITTFGTPRDPAMIERLQKAGVTRCIFGLKSAPADDVLRRLDRLVEFLKVVR
jgi:probable F420-dependent oxidoreductase